MVIASSPVFAPSYLDKLMPCDLEAEESILGSLLLDGKSITIIADKLAVEAFYLESHQKIYQAMKNLHKQQKHINLLSVINYLETKGSLQNIGGRNKLSNLLDRTVTSVAIESMVDLVMDKYIRRLAISLGNQIICRGFDDFSNSIDFVRHVEEEALQFTKSWGKGEDFDKWEYNRLIEAIRNIEYSISDPAYKLWKLQLLAKEFRKTPKDLEQLYLKSLADFSQQPLKGLRELDEECGTDDREWLLYGFLPKATTIVFHAEGGVGKTKLIYELAYNLVTGSAWSGYPVTSNQRKVLCYQTDESPHDMRQALRSRGFTQDMENFKYRTNWVIDAIPQLVQDIEEFRPDLIVIDSLTSVSRYSIFEENSTEYARPLLQLVQLASQYGCTIIVIHHSNAEGRARGTRAIRNSVSEVWHLKEDNSQSADGLERMLEIEKSRSRSKAKYRLRFDPENYSWHCLGKEGEEMNDQNLSSKILQFLGCNRNVCYRAGEIAQNIQATEGSVRRCLNSLRQDGLVSRKEEGGFLGHKNRPYLYYLAGEHELVGYPNADRIPPIPILRMDQNQNSQSVSDSDNADPGIKFTDRNCIPSGVSVSANADRDGANFSENFSSENPKKSDTVDQHCPKALQDKENDSDPHSDPLVQNSDRNPQKTDTSDQHLEKPASVEVNGIYWWETRRKNIKIVKVVKSKQEAVFYCSGEAETYRAPLSEIFLVPGLDPTPPASILSKGDKVRVLAGYTPRLCKYKDKVMLVVDISGDSVFLREDKPYVMPVGPYDLCQLEKVE